MNSIQITRCCYKIIENDLKENYCLCKNKEFQIIKSHPFNNLVRKILNVQMLCQTCSNSSIKFCHTCHKNICSDCIIKCQKHQLGQVNQDLKRFDDCKLHCNGKQYYCSCNYTALCKVCMNRHKQKCKLKVKRVCQLKKQLEKTISSAITKINYHKENCCKLLETLGKAEEKEKELFQQNLQTLEEGIQSLHQLIELKKMELISKIQNDHQKTIKKLENQIKKCLTINQEIELYGKIVATGQNNFQVMVHLVKWGAKIVEKKIYFNQDDFFSNKEQTILNLQKIEENLKNIAFRPRASRYLPSNSARQLSSKKNETPKKTLSSILKDNSQSNNKSILNNVSIISTPFSVKEYAVRPLQVIPSNKQIFVKWCHFPHQQVKYELEYGIGLKIKGTQIFKRNQISNGKAIIQGLNSQTMYRIRLRAINKDQIGPWNQIVQVRTLPQPIFQIDQKCNFAVFKKPKHLIQFVKQGILYSNNPILFGVHQWTIEVIIDKHSTIDQTGRLVVGISNKNNKKVSNVGASINYGLQKQNLIIKVRLDIKQNVLRIIHPKKPDGQIFTVFPQLPVYGFIQNKGESKSVIINIKFN